MVRLNRSMSFKLVLICKMLFFYLKFMNVTTQNALCGCKVPCAPHAIIISQVTGQTDCFKLVSLKIREKSLMRVLLFLNVLGYSNEYGSSNLGNIAQLWNVCRAVSFSWCMTVLGGCIMRREECV